MPPEHQNHIYPLITIGMCCYKSTDTVGRAVDSALAQDWPNFELLVIDDGSKDGTAEVIAEKIKGHENARLILHDTNKTFPGALNTVIKEAKGEFIAIFDDDDASLPERLRIQYQTITAYEEKTGAELVACWGSGVRKYPNGYNVEFQAIGSKPQNPIGTMVIDYLLLYRKRKEVFYGSGTPSCSLMTRKSTYDAIGPYDESMVRSEDVDFSARLALKGGHFIGCSEKILIQYSTNTADKSPEINLKSKQTLVSKYQEYLVSIGYYYYALTWPKIRYYHFKKQYFKMFITFLLLFIRHPLKATRHIFTTGPKRLIHEWKMGRKNG